MLSKKSFLADEQNFLAPLVDPMLGNVRDHIESQQNDHRPSHMPCRGLRRRRQRKTDLREIFGAAQFSTFSTASVKNGPRGLKSSAHRRSRCGTGGPRRSARFPDRSRPRGWLRINVRRARRPHIEGCAQPMALVSSHCGLTSWLCPADLDPRQLRHDRFSRPHR